MKLRRGFLAFAIVAAIAIGFSFTAPSEKYFDIAKSLDIFATLFKEVNAYYVDEIDPKDLVDKGITGIQFIGQYYIELISRQFKLPEVGYCGCRIELWGLPRADLKFNSDIHVT